MDKHVGVWFRAREELTREMGKMRRGISRFTNFAKSAFGGIAAAITAVAIGRFFKSSIQVAEEGEKVWRRLDVALKNVGIQFKDVEGDIRGMAAQLQATTRFGDEEFAESFGTLLGITNDYNKSLQAVSVSMGLAVKHQIDLETASQLVGRGLVGQTGTFSRYGIIVDNTKDILEQLTEASKGYAEESGRGIPGAIAKIRNAFGDMQQALGNAILGVEAAEGAGTTLVSALQTLEKWITENSESIQQFTLNVVNSISAVGRFFAVITMVRNPERIGRAGETSSILGLPTAEDVQGRIAVLKRELQAAQAELQPLQERIERAVFGEWSPFLARERAQAEELRAAIVNLDALISLAETRLAAIERGAPAKPKKPTTPATSEPGEGFQRVRQFGFLTNTQAELGETTDPRNRQDDLPIRSTFGAIADQAPQVGEAIREHLLGPLGDTQSLLHELRFAFADAFVAGIEGSNTVGQALVAGVAGGIKQLAGIRAKEQFALAAAKLAEGLFPPNPAALASAAKHTAAGLAFRQLGGAAGSIVGGGSVGGAGSAPVGGRLAPGTFERDQTELQRNRGSLTLKLPQNALARTDDPVFVDWIAQGFQEAVQRGVVDVTVEVGA